ncbi:TPA: hypothetical protein QCU10_005839 [Bacillus anthracis]|nr:hypothetical protein [Bacillus cereus biovar anthracis]HDR6227719.1 hypothetical protein [Bacillus cereus biovar anthracis]HDR6230959.1 hypothetical protein [Bacillus cereus biovar anthracis]HDR6240486.1 hypothetical protein [Bacillus cereus biovar anthracis]HDR6252430.1 hypothetical protein [Bacillus cereus biovar anthracis]
MSGKRYFLYKESGMYGNRVLLKIFDDMEEMEKYMKDNPIYISGVYYTHKTMHLKNK